MAHYAKLEYEEPVSLCEIKVGTFYWRDAQGEQCDGDFYVKTCEDSDQSKQVDDFNEQYTDEFYRLMQIGYTDIKFVEISPSPIF